MSHVLFIIATLVVIHPFGDPTIFLGSGLGELGFYQ